MNWALIRKPVLIILSDASEIGIGVHCPRTGITWRYYSSNQEVKIIHTHHLRIYQNSRQHCFSDGDEHRLIAVPIHPQQR